MNKIIIKYLILQSLLILPFEVYSQILKDGGRINANRPDCMINWTNAGLLPRTRTGGLQPVTPNINADNLFIIARGGDCNTKILEAIEKARKSSGTSIIFFPGGIYEISVPIVLDQSLGYKKFYFSRCRSKFNNFTIGKDGNCFDIRGNSGAYYSINSNINKKDKCFTCSSSGFTTKATK